MQGFRLQARLGNSERAQLGVQLGDLISGDVDVDLTVRPGDDDGQVIRIAADLTAAELQLSDLAWSKPSGQRAELKFDIGKRRDGNVVLQNFRLDGDTIGVSGWVALGAMLCGVSGLAFAIGVYLPLASMLTIYVGGCLRAAVERGRKDQAQEGTDAGVLAASGLVAGEGLAGVAIAFLAWRGWIPKSQEAAVEGLPGEVLGLVVVAAIGTLLLAAGRRRQRSA